MVSLMDVVPLRKSVPLSTGDVIEVGGVTAVGLASMANKFPEIKALLAGKADPKLFTFEGLIDKAPRVVAAILADGCGFPGNEEAEAKAAALPISDQLEIFEAILDLTFAKGIGPFVAAAKRLFVRVSDDGIKAPALNSRKPSKS
jgi:hypothetical protein